LNHPSLQILVKSEHPSLQLTDKSGHASLEYVPPEPPPTIEPPTTIKVDNFPDFQSTFQSIVAELQQLRSEFSKHNNLRGEVLMKLKTKLETT
jgi:hypothetical protein